MLTMLLPLLEVNHLPIPAWSFGVIAFAALMIMLVYVTGYGGSRPHS